MELIDTHTHLDFPDFDADRQALLAESRALGVRRIVVLGVYQANWQRVWELVQSDPDLHAAFGLHPVYLDDHRPEDLSELGDWLTRLAGHRQLCAVGEIGLDYFIETLDRDRQQALFEAQLQLAADFDLPALIHVRRSHAAVIATLKRFQPETGRHHPRLRRQPGRSPGIHQARVSNSASAAPRPGRRRCACTGCSPNCRWIRWCWKPTRRTWPPPCSPASATARRICRRSARHWPTSWLSAPNNWPPPAPPTAAKLFNW